MELYILLLITSVIVMGILILYSVKKAKEEISTKVDEIACKVDPLVKRISGEEYECKEGEIHFKTQE